MICNKNESNSVELVADCLKKGGVVIIPTDTVYGFSGIVDINGSESFNTDAKIRTIKGRAEEKPFIQLISDPDDIKKITDDNVPDAILSKWPGPLTIIVNVKENLSLGSTHKTVALRCPGDPWLRKIIKNCGSPIFSTSVNRSGFPVLDEITKIVEEFRDCTDLIVSDGDKKGAVPSTIVSIVNGKIDILRQGAVEL